MIKLGFGGASIADYPHHISGEKSWREEEREDAILSMTAFSNSGYKIIDTAHRYGNGESERVVGMFLEKNEVSPGEYFVISKIGIDSISSMYKMLMTTKARLGRFPDALLLHNPDFGNINELQAICRWMLEDVWKMGIRTLGFSTEPTREVEWWYNNYGFNAIQFPFSIYDDRAVDTMFPWLEKKKSQGLMRIANRILGGPEAKGGNKSKKDIKDSIDWVVKKREFIDVALVGTTKVSHAIESCQIFQDSLREVGVENVNEGERTST